MAKQERLKVKSGALSSVAVATQTWWAVLPNAISVFRVFLVVPIVWGLLRGEYIRVLSYLLVASVSDGVDGYLARRFRWCSGWGAVLDPIADKLLLLSVFGMCLYEEMVSPWFFALLVFREACIFLGSVSYRHMFGAYPQQPSFLSKFNTAYLFGYLFALFMKKAWGWGSGVAYTVYWDIAVWGGVCTMLASGLHYYYLWHKACLRGKRP